LIAPCPGTPGWACAGLTVCAMDCSVPFEPDVQPPAPEAFENFIGRRGPRRPTYHHRWPPEPGRRCGKQPHNRPVTSGAAPRAARRRYNGKPPAFPSLVEAAATGPDDAPREPPRHMVLRLALFEPDIPQNAGALLRLAACLGVAVDVVE